MSENKDLEQEETSSTSKRLTPAEWAQVVELYELGKATMQELANTFGISKTAIFKGLKNRGAVKGERDWEVAIDLNQKIKETSSEKLQKIIKMKDNFDKVSDYLLSVTVKELKKIEDLPENFEKKKLMQVALKNSVDNLAKLRNEKYHLYDLYKDIVEDDKLPEIAVTEYSSDEIELLQRRDFNVKLVEGENDIVRDASIAMETAEEIETLENNDE